MRKWTDWSCGNVLVLVAISGCGPPRIASGEGIPADAVAELESKIAGAGSLTFESWDGKWIGMDCDTDIIFLPDHELRMVEYGDGVDTYHGSYRINGDGEVTINLSGYGRQWPRMFLRKDPRSLLLRPVSNSGFIMGNRGGAALQGGSGNFWPFRPIAPTPQP
jgi:hypothetical protein